MRLTLLMALWLSSQFTLALSAQDAEHWRQDIEAYANQLQQRHINLHHSLPKHYFQQQLQTLKQQLPELSRKQVLVKLMRLTSALQDSHTAFPLWGNSDLHSFPIRLSAVGQHFYVTASSDAYQHLLGSQVLAVEGIAIEQLSATLAPVVPFTDNAYSQRQRTAQYLTVFEVLNGLGIAADRQTTWQLQQGNRPHSVSLTAASDSNGRQHELSFFSTELFKPVEQINSDLWFGASKSHRTVYVRFHRYPDADDMADFANELLDFINAKQTRQLIIDLRDNYGGDFFIGLMLAQPLVLADSIDWQQGVFVLTDNVTYSAAMSNAAQYQQILNARLVGEPTGARPSGYQDMGTFTLPHSQWQVSYSKRLYRFKNTDQDALYPDVLIERTLEDYLTTQDAALDWIVEQLKQRGSF